MRSVKPRVVVTGGPTREWIDPVRFLSNPSSGKMGIALARAAYQKNYTTEFIHGPIDHSLLKDLPFKTIPVETTGQLHDAVLGALGNNVILIMAAAPADYTPNEVSKTKIKKGDSELVLRLARTPDILQSVARARRDGHYSRLFVVGFAAETNDSEQNALKKLDEKDLDLICLNDVSQPGAGFTVDTNIVTLYKRDKKPIRFPVMGKHELAVNILNEIESVVTG